MLNDVCLQCYDIFSHVKSFAKSWFLSVTIPSGLSKRRQDKRPSSFLSQMDISTKINDGTLFQTFSSICEPRAFSTVGSYKHETNNTTYDFISVLAAAQKLHVDLLPITWQETQQSAGEGGTADIKQRLINLHMSFAFKKHKEKEKIDRDKSFLFSLTISELEVLGNPVIREHPNIIQLQGVCFDIGSDNKIWPVLVFEKSQYGDLYNFAKLPAGSGLNFEARVQICVDIGLAISDMHSNGIVHGDIKPQNVIIFKELSGAYMARVTDFGYSSRFSSEDDRFALPRSEPWSAPEVTRAAQKFKPSQARKADVFSFAMLCLWLLFSKHSCGNFQFPEALQLLDGPATSLDTENFLNELKQIDKLHVFALNALDTGMDLDESKIALLANLFTSCLCTNPEERNADIGILLTQLSSRSYSKSPPSAARVVNEFSENKFEIVASLHELYSADYRLRPYISDCLSSRYHFASDLPGSSYKNTSLQLAFCYRMGFGVTRDDDKTATILQKGGLQPGALDELITRAKFAKSKPFQSKAANKIFADGNFPFINPREHFRIHGRLEEVDKRLRREIEGLQQCLGDENILAFDLKMQLAPILLEKVQWEEAEELLVDAVQTSSRTLGPDDPNTLNAMGSLAATYRDAARWAPAEELLNKVVEGRTRVLGPEHPMTLLGMIDMADLYRRMERNGDAENLGLKILAIRSKTLGNEHQDTISSMINLGVMYMYQGRWSDSEKLMGQAYETSSRVLGQDHLETVTSLVNLAGVYRHQDREDADEFEKRAVESCVRVLGERHPLTLASMANLAAVHNREGRDDKAGDLIERVFRVRKEIWGHHPETWNAMLILASVYRNQFRLSEAEDLLREILDVQEAQLGAESLFRIRCMNALASVLRLQGRIDEGLEQARECVRKCNKQFGPEHYDTKVCQEALENFIT